MPSRLQTRARDRADQPCASPPVAEHAARPARVHPPAELQRPRHLERARREMPLAFRHDSPRAPVAAASAREHVARELGDRLHGIARVRGSKRWHEVSVADPRAEPLAAEPETRALVAEDGPEAAGARPATARV